MRVIVKDLAVDKLTAMTDKFLQNTRSAVLDAFSIRLNMDSPKIAFPGPRRTYRRQAHLHANFNGVGMTEFVKAMVGFDHARVIQVPSSRSLAQPSMT